MPNPSIVRIVVDGWTWCKGQADNVDKASSFLAEAFDSKEWPGRIKYAVTPGGFIRTGFPDLGIVGGWKSEGNFHCLLEAGSRAVTRCLTDKVLKEARKRTRYLTLGVDLNDTDQKAADETHAELVAVVDTKLGKIIQWTGKSYPTGSPNDQSKTLVQAPLETHLFDLGGDQVLILGCHDLHMFTNRGKPRGQRKKRKKDMRTLARKFQPNIVLHHPHTTYSPQIWSGAWGSLQGLLSTVAVYASGIAFCGKPQSTSKWNCRQTLRQVLDSTKSSKEGDVYDVVVKGYTCCTEQEWLKWAEGNC